MRKGITTLVGVLAMLCTSTNAAAQESHPFRAGFGMDLGAPSGLALGLVVHPYVDWLSLQASLTFNGFGPGARLAAKIDPVAHVLPNSPLGILFDVQGGVACYGNMPGSASQYPTVGYEYVNLYGGFRFGKVNRFHWIFEVGPSYINFNVMQFQNFVRSQFDRTMTAGNPSVNGWVNPTFITGFEIVW